MLLPLLRWHMGPRGSAGLLPQPAPCLPCLLCQPGQDALAALCRDFRGVLLHGRDGQGRRALGLRCPRPRPLVGGRGGPGGAWAAVRGARGRLLPSRCR